MTNEYQQSISQMFVGHLITSAVYLSLLLAAVDSYCTTALYRTQLVCPLMRNHYFFGISDSLRSHCEERNAKLFEYRIKIHHPFLTTTSSRNISRNRKITIVFHQLRCRGRERVLVDLSMSKPDNWFHGHQLSRASIIIEAILNDDMSQESISSLSDAEGRIRIFTPSRGTHLSGGANWSDSSESSTGRGA